NESDAIEVFRLEEATAWTSLRWSPGGTDFLVSDGVGGKAVLYLVPRLGGTPRMLPAGGLYAWSPDGRELATCFLPREHGMSILTRSGDLKGHVVLEGAYTWINSIDWSPAGPWIVLTTSAENGGAALWVLNVDSRGEHKILEDASAELWNARWS